MKNYQQFLSLSLLLLISACAAVQPSKEKTSQAISSITSGMDVYPGFFNYFWDEKAGKIWLEIDRFEEEFLYVNSLSAGIGSNDIGLDRGILGDIRVVKFQRVGPKVLLVQPNMDYRASSENVLERQSVEQAFAQSVLAGFKVEAEEDGRVLVDITGFLLHDENNVIGRLDSFGQGQFSLDESRSAIYLPRTKNFPENSEFECTLTFTGENPGRHLRSVTPTPGAVTVRQHQSFIQLPDSNYTPRVFDPRAGVNSTSYLDYSAAVDEPLVKRFIRRHRLQKKDPNAVVSEPVEPIVYYLDNGTPEPVRTALLEGARWWDEAFEAAGFKNAFHVEVLPDDADPMDVRYNVIQWVHRSTRGWSYGRSVVDPRTGEIMKGHVTLGSLRIRQDYLIAEGLLSPYSEGEDMHEEMLGMSLARIRQLSAHEIGHTLGFSHNFAASVRGRASVMDYPQPKVTILEDGTFDLSDAYDTGIGDWDKRAVLYAYYQFPDGVDEEAGLQDIIRETLDSGLLFISDRDARSQSGSHPVAHLWDNGSDPVDELSHIMQVRERALERFSENNIPEGEPMSTLEDVLVPVYLYHRYQVEAVGKLVGGLDFSYNLRGDGQKSPAIVSAQGQREALRALLGTLDAEVLALPESIIEIIPPTIFGYSVSREHFNRRTGMTFDPISAVEAAVDPVLAILLNSQRAARLIEFEARNSENPGLAEVIDTIFEETIKSHRNQGYEGEIERVVGQSVLYRMIQLAADEQASAQVRAVAMMKLDELKGWLSENIGNSADDAQKAHRMQILREIEKFQENPGYVTVIRPVDPPPGSPIGSGSCEIFKRLW